MSYTISNPDGTTLLILGDRKLDQSTTSLTLVGKNWSGYGEHINNNFIKLLSSHASPNVNPPRSPVKGQLWYDTTVKRLKVYDETFKTISGAIISDAQPSLVSGDLWWDSSNVQLKISSGGEIFVIGPAFPASLGNIGFLPPKEVVKDIDGSEKHLSVLWNRGTVLGFLSNESFFINTATNYSYLTSVTTSTVKGLTVFGDIKYTGKIQDNYLTLGIDFDTVFSTAVSTNRNISIDSHFQKQHQAIVRLLNWTFPVNNSTGTVANTGNINSIESGVPVGSESKVTCRFTLPSPGYQVRRYVAKSSGWDMVVLNPSVTTLTNVVNTFYQGDIF